MGNSAFCLRAIACCFTVSVYSTDTESYPKDNSGNFSKLCLSVGGGGEWAGKGHVLLHSQCIAPESHPEDNSGNFSKLC